MYDNNKTVKTLMQTLERWIKPVEQTQFDKMRGLPMKEEKQGYTEDSPVMVRVRVSPRRTITVPLHAATSGQAGTIYFTVDIQEEIKQPINHKR